MLRLLKPHSLLIMLLALHCMENLARAVLSIQQATLLPDLPTTLSPVYLAISSTFWVVVFAACIISVARAWHWAPYAVLSAALTYQAEMWINRLAYSANSEALAVVGFRAMLSIIILSITVLLVWLTRKRYNP